MSRAGMTTYVLGAGASLHAGYPLVKDMGKELFAWMKKRERYSETVEALEKKFGVISDLERLLDKIENEIERRTSDCPFANRYKPHLAQAIRGRFAEIHQEDRATAYQLLAKVIRPGDCVITFNYDVSLDRELKRANLWTLGDGYGFPVEGFEVNSPVTILKLHGSIDWLASMCGGSMGFFALGPNGVFGHRPIFCDSSLEALGYEDKTDPFRPRTPFAALPPMILPTSDKRFYFDTNLGREWESFWDSIWRKASEALVRSARVSICGYGMLTIDQRGCDLLLNGPLSAEFEVCSGRDTERIVQNLREHGRRAQGVSEVLFGPWVEAQRICG